MPSAEAVLPSTQAFLGCPFAGGTTEGNAEEEGLHDLLELKAEGMMQDRSERERNVHVHLVRIGAHSPVPVKHYRVCLLNLGRGRAKITLVSRSVRHHLLKGTKCAHHGPCQTNTCWQQAWPRNVQRGATSRFHGNFEGSL